MLPVEIPACQSFHRRPKNVDFVGLDKRIRCCNTSFKGDMVPFCEEKQKRRGLSEDGGRKASYLLLLA